jgi:uncharacterized protein (DUF2461 family)
MQIISTFTIKSNTDKIDAYLQAANLNATSPDHFHQAYKGLSARGLLQIDESKRVRTPRKQITQNDLYEMPLDELRSRANQQR